ncbi:hypothetical protein KIN20_003713 [Parelaphostrongylus tenuis]|uniref:RDD domain-containing protein n=1 Tax=Parelaphostrongylus tenuis TaxID=148309 RepID=A0AAD5QEM0_PARTN|nr:hypothetical protein KIN20_003713 [Parelaphostrongylus tenuis]
MSSSSSQRVEEPPAGREGQAQNSSVRVADYCEDLRRWMLNVQWWQAFQYNMAVAAYQNHQALLQSDATDTSLRRRHVPNFDASDANNLGPAPDQVEERPPTFPVPPSAQEAFIVQNPNGTDGLAAQFVVASYTRRFMAEVIDFVFAFLIKLVLIYYLVEMEFVDLNRFDKLLGNEADLQMLVDVTQELFPLELLGKMTCSLIEALCLSQSIFPRFCGQTPGKYFMGVRVIECESVSHVAGAAPNVVRVSGSVVIPFRAAMLRSMLKNILINSLVPFSTVAFAFNYNRAIYDIIAKTIVIVE